MIVIRERAGGDCAQGPTPVGWVGRLVLACEVLRPGSAVRPHTGLTSGSVGQPLEHLADACSAAGGALRGASEAAGQ